MMRGLSAAELLTIWEQGLSQPAHQRALLLLSAVYPDHGLHQLAQLSIGQRDTQLLTLREQTLGSQIVSIVTCPMCENSLELNFTVDAIRQTPMLETASVLSFQQDDYEIAFRLPNSLDLSAIAHLSDASVMAHQLLQRCILSVHEHGQSVPSDQISPELTQALLKQMEQADPQADVQLSLQCPDCGHQWQSTFDILTFFWQELTAWAQRLLQEVHQLASIYHWREADILAMSPQRRQFYLEMIQQ